MGASMLSGLDLLPFVLFGLLVGSFLNVVIHRTPKMLQRQWLQEAKGILADHEGKPFAEPAEPDEPSYNLVVPRSACPACGHQIKWFENIPVLSWLYLRGKCSACGSRISLRYPLVELLMGLCAGYCAARFGLTWASGFWAAFCALLIVCTMIDWDTTLLPDDLTLPLLWLGLIGAALGMRGLPSLTDALWGAVGGYMSLWLIFWAFKLLTAKEGMGYGDFKLFAALGAWFGWTALVPIILMASVVGAVVGIGLKLGGGLREGKYVPFGPFLAGAGALAFVFGPQRVLAVFGL